MSLDKCVRVNLNSDSTGCFYTGDIVTGTVILTLYKDQKIESIDLEVKGISKAQWTRSCPTIPYIKIYSEKKKVLFVKLTNIFGNIGYDNRIQSGVYSYPFHFILPQDLPSTFKNSTAKVHYCIKIKSTPIYKIKKVIPFTVLGNVNLNNMAEMLFPCVYEFTKVFKSLAGKVTIYIKSYKSTAPRQTIPFEMTIENNKNIRITDIHVILIQKVRYTVSSGYADDEKSVAKATYKNVGKSTTEFCYLSMEIPQLPPSTLYMDGPMIDIAYFFKVEVCFPFHLNLYGDLPVTIATSPVIFEHLPRSQ